MALKKSYTLFKSKSPPLSGHVMDDNNVASPFFRPSLFLALYGSNDHMDGGDGGVYGEVIVGDGCIALRCGETKKTYKSNTGSGMDE